MRKIKVEVVPLADLVLCIAMALETKSETIYLPEGDHGIIAGDYLPAEIERELALLQERQLTAYRQE